jgi:hypothetical protein
MVRNRFVVALSVLACLAGQAHAQVYPTPTFPLTGAETVLCIQGYAYKACSLSNLRRATPGGDWLSTYAYGSNSDTPLVAESNTGEVGVVGSSRNTDNSGGNSAAIGTMGWNFNFNSTTPAGGWAFYGEARHGAGAGPTLTEELDATEFGTAGNVGSYSLGSVTSGSLWLAAGGGCTSGTPCYGPNGTSTYAANPASLAAGIIPNGTTFKKGIVFGNAALTGCNGADAEVAACIAMEMGRDQFLAWDSVGTANQFLIGSVGTSASGGAKLLWTDSGLSFQNGAGTNEVILSPTGGVNAAGLIMAPAYAVGATAGVTCSGTPTSSFATVKGIVTHC